MTSELVLVVDWLHTGPLCALKYFLGWLVWQFIDKNIWHAPEQPMSTRLRVSAISLRAQLFDWYTIEAGHGRQHCRAQDLTHSMLGSHDDPQLGLHGAEMVGFLYFARWLLEQYGDALGPSKLYADRACSAFLHIHETMKVYPVLCPAASVQALVDSGRKVIQSLAALNVGLRFKMHALLHMCYDARFKGSPTLWACWTDEGLNKLLKDVSLAAHCRRDVWTERVLDSVQSVLDRATRRRV